MLSRKLGVLLLIVSGILYAEEITDVNLCMSSNSGSYTSLLLPASAGNPHSRAIGERVAGFVLLGTALLNFALAVPMGEMMESTSGDGETWKLLIITEGVIRGIIGGAFIGVGYSRYGKWKQWESENGGEVSASYQIGYTFEF